MSAPTDPPNPIELNHVLPRAPTSLTAEEVVEKLRLWEPTPAGGSGGRARVFLNMACTADGRATVGGRSGPIGNRADRELFHALRTAVDAVLVGAGTVRAERYRRLVRDESRRRLRRERGLAEEPLACIVSASLDLPADIPLLADPAARVAILTPSPDRELPGSAATDPGAPKSAASTDSETSQDAAPTDPGTTEDAAPADRDLSGSATTDPGTPKSSASADPGTSQDAAPTDPGTPEDATPADPELPRGAASVEYVRSARGGQLDLAAALAELRTRFGVRTLLCEGGPHLNSQLLAAGLVDELFLSLAPKLAGGGGPGGPATEHLRILSGPELDPPVELELLYVLESEGYLLLRYRVGGAGGAR
jgi:riboflavin biosynthesis pyrimidine reductase